MKILMVIAQQGFRDEEFQIPYDHFISQGVAVDVASITKGDCFGSLGMVQEADMAIEDASPTGYFAIVLVGGPGAKDYIGNPVLAGLLRRLDRLNMVISAICIAPLILAKAGFLKGKKATVWNKDLGQASKIEEAGGVYVDEDVVCDGRIITANGPQAAGEFAHKVLEVALCEDCWIR